MTESEIMRAFECCTEARTRADCKKINCPALEEKGYGCVYYNRTDEEEEWVCFAEIGKDLVYLINRKNAEIERLEKSKRLSDDLIEQMRITINNRTTENQKLKLDNEELKIINKNLDKLFLKARAEAIKEFAERVTKALYEADDVNPLTEYKIDQIAKEMGCGE